MFYSELTNLKWSDNDSSSTGRVKQEFGNYVNQSSLPDRVKKEMLKFIEAAKWQKLNS